MNPQQIEDQIKGLLGLNIGGALPATSSSPGPLQAASSTEEPSAPPPPGAYPRHKHEREQPRNDSEKQRKIKKRQKAEGERSDTCGDLEGEEAPCTTEKFLLSQANKEAKLPNPQDYKPPEPVIQFLAAKYLRPLKEKSTKFVRAKWFCHLCEYHCDNLSKCYEHYTDTRHSRLTRLKEIDFTLENIPSPNKLQCDSLNSLLANNQKEFGLSQEDVEYRHLVANTIGEMLEEQIPGSKIRLYGSSLTGFALKSSNINLDLLIPASVRPHLALLKSLEALKSSSEFRSVQDDFNSKYPAIKFLTSNGIPVELSLNNQVALQTSMILRDYLSFDPRIALLGVNFRYWASITKLDRQTEGTLPAHTFAILLIYFLQQTDEPVVPCIHDHLGDDEDVYDPSSMEKIRLSWRSSNTDSPAELWFKLFQFYSLQFNTSELVVSIRKTQHTTNEEKNWKSRKLAIEDPYSTKRNLCSIIQHPSVFHYITDTLKTGFLYFGTIQTSHGPIITRILPSEGEEEDEEEGLADWTLESWLACKGTQLTKKQFETVIRLVPKNMVTFTFNAKHLTDGSVPTVVCAVCSSEGHVANNCPEAQLPELQPLPSLNQYYVRMLDKLCLDAMRHREPTATELAHRDHIMRDLNGYIRRFFKNAVLTLFGSSSNGFAFRNSDLDISLTFTNQPTPENIDCIQIIEELAERIKRMSGVRNVEAITSAKVPIIKLFYQNLKVEADISLYNVLARENTKLLSLYADLDQRVRPLGYMAKTFAKICDIGDASRGSLSSYAYILMMIFYLQQTSPPVIPVLQELYTGDKPENVVDGWNAWFQTDKKVLSKWKTENVASLGQLWVGFLSFYAGDWDDRMFVVSIRQKEPLTKFEKMWNSHCIAIEDPFELSHNLGVGISRRMNLYIKKTFINGRSLFGHPKQGLMRMFPPSGRTMPEDYFLDHRKLTDGAPPNDRGCRACGKIGHLVVDCPRKRAADMKKKMNKERARTQSEQTGVESMERRDGRNRTRSEIPAAQLEEKLGKLNLSSTKHGKEAMASQQSVPRIKSKSVSEASKKSSSKSKQPQNDKLPKLEIFNYNSVRQTEATVTAFDYLHAPLCIDTATSKQETAQQKQTTMSTKKKPRTRNKAKPVISSASVKHTVDEDLIDLAENYLLMMSCRDAEKKSHQSFVI